MGRSNEMPELTPGSSEHVAAATATVQRRFTMSPRAPASRWLPSPASSIGKELVREETSQHVRAAAQVAALRSQRRRARRSASAAARPSASSCRTCTASFSPRSFAASTSRRAAQGYPHPRLRLAQRSPTRCWKCVETMRGRVDGLVVMAPDVTLGAARRAAARASCRWCCSTPRRRHGDAITIDNYGGARAMMRHLHGARAHAHRLHQRARSTTPTRASGCAATATPCADSACATAGAGVQRRLHRGVGIRRGTQARWRWSRGRRRSSPRTTRWPSACSPSLSDGRRERAR